MIASSCEGRVGFMGNPSDGFKGKTVSFLIDNFKAEVTIMAAQSGTYRFNDASGGNNGAYFASLDDFRAKVGKKKWYNEYEDGGVTLCMATFSMLLRCLDGMKRTVAADSPGFSISYSTTIPRCVGLSGSSAIITACWKVLLEIYGFDAEADLGIAKEYLPSLILEIEKRELDIAAGLQDRVIQTYRGLVHMDFSLAPAADATATVTATIDSTDGYQDEQQRNVNPLVATLTRPGKYTPLDPGLLPPLYLIYSTIAGGTSSGVHSTVKERWAQQEPSLVSSMHKLGGLADESVRALQSGDRHRLCELMNENFATRRSIYGDAVVGLRNIEVATKAKELGLAIKFCGSGGAFIAMRMGAGVVDEEEERAIVEVMNGFGFAMTRVVIPGK